MGYGGTGKPPHALTSISGTPDAMFGANPEITYTDFKKVKQITEGNNVLNISYGADLQRVKTVLTNSSGSLTRYYMGNYEEEIKNGNIRKIHYICGGNGLAAIYVQNAGQDTLYYAHTDYQGSLTALSLENGTVKERYAYDPWGNRRNPSNWTQSDTRTAFILNRGYTMHEHLPEFKLINMNGRVYDPLTSMFLSPDPYVQAPGDWLNYNRYAYAMNNPFMYTDPNGEAYYYFLMPNINYNPNSGYSYGITGGVGSGKFNAFVSLGYGRGNGFTTALGVSYVGGSAYVGYNTNAGFISGVGYGYGLGGEYFSFSSSVSSIGINYSANGGFSVNVFGTQYSKQTGLSADLSFGVSYTAKTAPHGTYDINDQSYLYDAENPMPYDNNSAYEFMKANELTDSNNKWRNLNSDGTLPPGYKYDEDGNVENSKGIKVLGTTYPVRKKYLFWGKQHYDIYLYKNAFKNPEILFFTIGHELVHVDLFHLKYEGGGQHEASAYGWEIKQAKALNMFDYATSLERFLDKKYPGFTAFPYQRPIRTSRPINPFLP